jgi:hypothetical protein
MNKLAICFIILTGLLSVYCPAKGQEPASTLWHGKEREVRYQPDGEDFIIQNGTLRFNRALYGGNTAFRAEAGDLPEFALYMPGMGGNLKFGFINKDSSKWIIRAQQIKARYRPGSMLYEIQDPVIGKGTFFLTVLPLFEGEGLLVKTESSNLPAGIQLFCAFGGASGKKFSRDGDIGADPESSFYLQPDYCKDNVYQLHKNTFTLYYGSRKPLSEEERYEVQHLPQKTDTTAKAATLKKLTGVFPATAQLKISDAMQQESPLLLSGSAASAMPVVTAQMPLSSKETLYFFIQNPDKAAAVSYTQLASLFRKSEEARKKLAERIKVVTPDPYINTLGGALGIAADAIWEDPTFLHGAVAWSIRLNAWRGAYAADPLGWHDRARRHFSSYALSQVVTPAAGPVVADTALHLARQLEKMGTSLFSSGYICRNPNGDIRPHHYDMNLVFIDELLNHFLWTGDKEYVRQMWPLLQRHLAWEKRNFDADDDGLYDAYCCIWASDALQYSGGGVTHSSAYNYRANRMAAELAALAGADGTPYKKEADKILSALNTKLWMPSKGWYAEYKDALGRQLLHPYPGLWTIYHAIDSKVPDRFQAWQSLRYIDHHIPHIPVKAKGLTDTTLYLLSTTNWLPYTWSLNNVALAELLHTSLAYWQGGDQEEAFRLWKSSLFESMYMSSAPGNFEQLSFYDAIRGELYRDFADPVGMAARSLVEGLFGIAPDALHDTLHLQPGCPAAWDHASLHTSGIDFDFSRKGSTDQYTLTSRLPRRMNLQCHIKAAQDAVESVRVNGKPATYTVDKEAVGTPELIITATVSDRYQIEIRWKGNNIERPVLKNSYAAGEQLELSLHKAALTKMYDPQQVLGKVQSGTQSLQAEILAGDGYKTVFVQVNQGMFSWWMPLEVCLTPPVEIIADIQEHNTQVSVQNHTASTLTGRLMVEGKTGFSIPLTISKNSTSDKIIIPSENFVAGSNQLVWVQEGKTVAGKTVVNWNVANAPATKYEKIDMSKYFNEKVTNIFRNRYLSPRPVSPTLQLPTQGIGNWCYPLTTANIDDAGLRSRAGARNEIVLAQGVPLATPGDKESNNILFTSQWDNYPDSATIPLTGRASHAYFLMAGSTNPMQSRLTNGEVIIYYKDGSSGTLELTNPENWWPVEQDYYTDNFAFTTGAPKPVRVYLKPGTDTREFKDFSTIKGFTNWAIDGGAATVLDLPLNKDKDLSHLVIKTVANDVVIGLMSVTVERGE